MPPIDAPTKVGGRDDRLQIGNQKIQRVGILAAAPAAVAMAARVECHDVIAALGELLGPMSPGRPRLAAAVQEQHRLALGIAAHGRSQAQPAAALQISLFHAERHSPDRRQTVDRLTLMPTLG
jgi:hypothetical protein